MKTTNPARRHLMLCLAALALAVPAAQAPASPLDWLTGEHVKGNGNIKTQSRPLGHFSALSLALPGKLELRMGESESVTIEADDNLLPLISSVIENGTLKLRPIRNNVQLDTRNLKLVVQARNIERIALGGSGAIEAQRLRAPKLDLSLGGSGAITIGQVEADALAVSLGGSGKLKAGGGAVRRVSVSIGGSGDVELGQVSSDEASVNVAGSGNATVWARNALSVSIAGSGDVNYYGDPQVSKTVIGSGSTRRLGGAPR